MTAHGPPIPARHASNSTDAIRKLHRRRRRVIYVCTGTRAGEITMRAVGDARSSGFCIPCVYEGHLKAEMRGFPTSHLRDSSDAVEGNRGHAKSVFLPPVLPPPNCQGYTMAVHWGVRRIPKLI